MPSDESKVFVPSPRTVAVREIQLIDRAEEMKILREAADRAVRGEGGVVFVYGEAGIGKTRLSRELGAYARSQGMQVLSGRCPALFKMDGVPPYVLWEEVIRDYLEACTPEQLFRVIGSYPVEVSKLVPELKQKLRTFPQSFPLSPEHSRDRLFEAVSQFITNIAKEAPSLVILDDLQWTDRSSLLLLHYLARGVYKESLLLLGAYRHTYIDKKHPLSPVLTELNRERLLQSIRLKRMSFDDVVEMIKRMLEQDDVSTEFCELVYERTRGNPFFVEEVIESLKEERVIYHEKNKWEIKEVSSIKFPETVKDVIKARIDRLDDEYQRVLTTASFVGKDFTFEALCGVTGVEEDKLLEIVEGMLKTGMLKHKVVRGADVFSFADIIVRDVVYAEVGPLRRKKLHGAVGRTLEKVYAKEIDEHLGELSYHFLEGGEKEKALDYFLKAGERAAKICANSEAASYFQSALRLLEEKEGELLERGRVLEQLGDIKSLVGEYDAAMMYWNKALLLWKQLHEKEKVARLHRKAANLLWNKMGDADKAKEHHEKALKIWEGELESVELASLYEDVAERVSMGRTGDLAEARSWAEKALKLAEKLNAHEVIAKSYACLGEILGWLGDTKKLHDYMERALKISLENNYIETALFAYNDLGSILELEDNERSLEYYEKGMELAKKVGDIFWTSWIGAHLADVHIRKGNMNKAIAFAEESLELDRKAGNLTHLPVSLNVLGFAYQIMGEWDKTEQYYKEALSIAQELDQFQQLAGSHFRHGMLHFEKKEYSKAKKSLEKGYEIFERHGAKLQQMWVSSGLAVACIELGEIEEAKNLIDKLHSFALEAKDRRLVAFADASRAMQFRAQKKWKQSIDYFEKCLREWEALEARRWNVYDFAKRVLCEYAQVYIERERKDDKERARNLLNQALEIFKTMGAKKDIEEIESRMILLDTGRQAIKPEPVAGAALPERVGTGYEDLDDLLLGGIPRNYAVVLTSPSCDERDLLIKRFLEAGAKDDQITFYVTTKASGVESLVEEFPSNFFLFVCNPQADKIVKTLPNVFKLKGVENLTDIDIALRLAFRRLDAPPKAPRRICLDVISDVLLQHQVVQTRKWVNALIPKLTSKGFTTLALMDSEIHPEQEVRAIVGVFEGEINIHDKETAEGLKKHLKIRKMIDQKYSESERLLSKEKLQR